MKKLFFLALATLLVVACPSDPDKIECQTSVVSFSSDADQQSISFTASPDWTAIISDSDATWCTISPSSGSAGSGKITVKVIANSTYDSRRTEIELSAGASKHFISVEQEEKKGIIATPTNHEVNAEGGFITIQVKSNVKFAYTIASHAKEWIAAVDSKGLETQNLIFDISPNKDSKSREGEIMIYEVGSSNEQQKITISQKGTTPNLKIDKKSFTVSAEGEEISVNVTSNIDLDVITPSWINSNGVKSGVYKFEIEENTDYDSRKGEIIFKNDDLGISEKVTVTQMQKDAIVIGENRYDIAPEGGEFTVRVGHNIDYKTTIDADWITKVNTKAYEEDRLTFRVAENSGESREGKIIFKSNDNKITQTITVSQAKGGGYIQISKTEYNVSAETQVLDITVKSDLEFEVMNPNVSWLTKVSVTNDAEIYTLRYRVSANTSYSSRSTEIKIKNPETGEVHIITVIQAQKDVLSITKKTYEIGTEGGTVEVKVQTNVEYDVTPGVSWITKVNTKAYGEESVTLNVASYSGNDSRQGKVTFTSKDEKLKQEITITQLAGDIIEITKTEYELTSEKQTLEIEVKSNIEFEIVNPSVSWLKYVGTKAMQTSVLQYDVSANTSYNSRSAEIKIKNPKTGEITAISVTQAQKDRLYISKTTYQAGPEGGDIEVKVQTNVEYNVTPYVSWIKKVDTKAYGTESVTLNVSENTGDDSREGKVAFTSKDNKLKTEITITQLAGDIIEITQTEYQLTSEKQTLEIEVKSNIEFEIVNPSVSWLKYVGTKAMQTSVLQYEVSANNDYESRSTEVRIKNPNTGETQTITITQAQKDVLTISTKAFTVGAESSEILVQVRSNVEYEINITQPWIEKLETRAYSTERIIFIIKENTGSSRSGEVVFTSKDEKLTQTVTITQEAAQGNTDTDTDGDIDDIPVEEW